MINVYWEVETDYFWEGGVKFFYILVLLCPLTVLLFESHAFMGGEGASLVAQWWRTRLPTQEMQVESLGWENPLEKEMATQSSILFFFKLI